jgi:hypothetical protein
MHSCLTAGVFNGPSSMYPRFSLLVDMPGAVLSCVLDVFWRVSCR